MQDIPGFEGLYQIDQSGNVINSITKKLRKQTLNTMGYSCVNLKKRKKQHLLRIHRILALLWIPNPMNKPNINHKNGIKTDNRLDNLEWCTQSENIKHSYDILKRCLPDGPRNAKSKLVLDLETGIFYDSIKFACIAKGLNRNVVKPYLRKGGKFKSLQFA